MNSYTFLVGSGSSIICTVVNIISDDGKVIYLLSVFCLLLCLHASCGYIMMKCASIHYTVG